MAIQNNKQYFKEIKEWSERKLKILTDYLDPATKILSSMYAPGRFTKVYYVDGFAGAGVYEDGSKGSPIRAAELARSYRDLGKSYSLKCINVEENAANFRSLQKEIGRFGTLTLNLFGSFASNAQKIVAEIGETPTICFLDPFGVEGMDWDAVTSLIQRRGPTDFWIRFDAEYVLRLDGFYESMAPEAAKKLDILKRTYGINDINQIHMMLNGPTPEIRKQKAIDLYLGQLRSAFKLYRGEGYAASYPIKTLEEEDKYHLVFACGNKKGFVLASNVVYGIEETYQREVQTYKENNTPQASMFAMMGMEPTEEEIFESKVEIVKGEIWKFCQGQTKQKRDIHAHIIALPDWFGRIKAPHMTRALRDFCDAGSVLSITSTVGDEEAILTFRP